MPSGQPAGRRRYEMPAYYLGCLLVCLVFSRDGGAGLGIRQRVTDVRNLVWRKVGKRQLVTFAPFLHFACSPLCLFFIQTCVASQIDSLRRESEAGAGGVHDVHDAQQDIFLDGQELAVILGQNVAERFPC